MHGWLPFFRKVIVMIAALSCGHLCADPLLDIEAALSTERERPGSLSQERWEQLFSQIPPEEAPLFLMKAINEKDSLAIRLCCQYVPCPQSVEMEAAFVPLCSELLLQGYIDHAFELAQKTQNKGEHLLMVNTHLAALLIDQHQIERWPQAVTERPFYGHALLGYCLEESHFEAGAALIQAFLHEEEIDEFYALPEIVVLLAKTGHADEIPHHLEKTFRYRQKHEISEADIDDYKERACVNLFDADCFEEALALWKTVDNSDLPSDDEPDALEWAEEVDVAYCKALARRGQIQEALHVFEKLRSPASREDASPTCFATLLTLERGNEAQTFFDRFNVEEKGEILRRAVCFLLEQNCDIKAFSLLQDLEHYPDDKAKCLPKACSILASKGKIREACQLLDQIENDEWKEDVLDTIFDFGLDSPSLVNVQILIDTFPEAPLTSILVDSLRLAKGELTQILAELRTLDPETREEKTVELCNSFALYNRIKKDC